MACSEVPKIGELYWPTLKALEQLGGSATIEELAETIAKNLDLTEEALEIVHKEGPITKLYYRTAWVRTFLKNIGAVENSERGVWSITEIGRSVPSSDHLREMLNNEAAARQRARKADSTSIEDNDLPSGAEIGDDEPDWQETLLSTLMELDPSAFERLCQRILRESGFTKVEVTGRVGDEGIDGTGVLRVKLLSFQVLFQCKRYANSVSSGAIRDFRGAMVGRADKGLFITTGRFTKSAEREAVRDGAPAIDLIDGVELCHLLKDLKLGVQIKTVEEVEINSEFFARV